MLKRHPYLSSTLILFVLILVFVTLLNATQSNRFALLEEGIIGLIEVKGVILDSQEVVTQIKKMEKADSIQGVVLRINSPGGGVAASQEIYEALLQLRSKNKKVYTSMGSVAASGGYYIAVATDKIYANPGTMTGSIGVLMEWYNFNEFSKKIGVSPITIQSGKNKKMMSMFREPLESERQILDSVIQDSYEQFVAAILSNRSQMEEAHLRALADGRIFTGKQAKAEGLIDGLASYEQVIQQLAKDLNLHEPVHTLQFDEKERSLPFFLNLLGLSSVVKQFMASTPTMGFNLSYLLK
ncbi:signal peptide peptidase SppA [Deltaproteobacteria bacterium TL4]